MTTEAAIRAQTPMDTGRRAAPATPFLRAALDRLRLLLEQRVAWIRSMPGEDPLQGYRGLVISETEVDRLLGETGAAPVDAALLPLTRDGGSSEGADASLLRLADRLALSEFDRDVLLLCLAPELDPAFERLYAYVQDDATRKYPTAHLAVSLLAAGDLDGARARLLPHAPLRRHRLIRVDTSNAGTTAGSRPLLLDEGIAAWLLGREHTDERVAALLRPIETAPLAPEQSMLASRLARMLAEDGHRVPNLVGPPNCGLRTLSAEVCANVGLHGFALDPRRLPPAGPDRGEVLRLLVRDARLRGHGLVVDATEMDRSDRDAVETVRGLVELDAPVLLLSREPFADARTLTVPVPPPTSEARRVLWLHALGPDTHQQRTAVEESVGALVEQFDLSPAGIRRAVETARHRAGLRGAGAPSHRDLWDACRDLAGGRLEELAQRITPVYGWEDIVLPPETLAQLRDIAAQAEHRSTVYDSWGFGRKLARGRGIAALFAGPSGTGKTMAAEILAGHLRLDLFRIDLSAVVSKYIGETEKNLRRVFDAAEGGGAILFFDEADALFGKRSEVKDSHDRYANIEVNYLLQRMEEYRGLAILATNMKSLLDQAFLRRLRFLIDFPFPDSAHRAEIWRRVFPPEAPVGELDVARLARLQVPGGNIRNIALNAAFLAAGEGASIRMQHVYRAARREYAKIDKLVLESEFGEHYAGPEP